MKKLILVIALAAFLSPQVNAIELIGGEKADSNAWYKECKNKVKGMLKSPISAKFSGEGTLIITDTKPSKGFLDSTVHSQNSYGAMLPFNFTCSGKKGEIKVIKRFTLEELKNLGR